MHKNLFILGNGFDLIHELPTKYYASGTTNEKSKSPYRDFAQFFEDKYQEAYEAFYLFACRQETPTSDMWSKFEKLFANVNNKEIIKYLTREDDELEGNDDDDEISNHFGTIEARISAQKKTIDDQLTRLISNALCDWILSLNYEDVNQDIVDKLSLKLRNADCLTFNYSHTLEKFYKKNNLNILHIHGKAEPYNENSNLIFGHGDDSNSDINIDEPLGLYREIVAQSVLDDETANSKKLLRKNIDERVSLLQPILSKASNYNKVYIIGHSLEKVDRPYFEEIANSLSPASQIIISYYGNNEFPSIKKNASLIFKRFNYSLGDLDPANASNNNSFWKLYNKG